MVKVERWIDVPPEQVFEVLSDAPNPLLEPLVRLRNKRTLARLSRTAADRRSS